LTSLQYVDPVQSISFNFLISFCEAYHAKSVSFVQFLRSVRALTFIILTSICKQESAAVLSQRAYGAMCLVYRSGQPCAMVDSCDSSAQPAEGRLGDALAYFWHNFGRFYRTNRYFWVFFRWPSGQTLCTMCRLSVCSACIVAKR